MTADAPVFFSPSGLSYHWTPEPMPADVREITAAHYRRLMGWTVVADAEGFPVLSPESLRAQLKDAATAERWRRETGGLTTPDGVAVKTGLSDQARLTSIVSNATLAKITEVQFKTADGTWAVVPVAQVKKMAAAVALHVQAHFAAECAHHQAIDALADEYLTGYDVSLGWPA